MSSNVVILSSLLMVSACGGTDGDETVRLSGSFEKGPFILGSSISISAIDAAGNPSGQVFLTETTNDHGNFSVVFSYTGAVTLRGDGFYYNEVSEDLSTAPITLRAFHEVTSGGEQNAYINLITHLTYQRVATLIQLGGALPTAVAQAEQELRAGLGVGPDGFDPMASGIQMNVLGDDTDGNAYLLAVSAVLAQATFTQGGSIDANLQLLGNRIASDLAVDGALDQGTTDTLLDAQRRVNPDRVMTKMQERFGVAVPDINRVIDTDLDGIVNATDNCRRAVNPLQEDQDDDGTGDACEGAADFEPVVDFPTGNAPAWAAVTDVNTDGKPDLVVSNNLGSDSNPVASFSVLLNLTETGASMASFAPKADFPAGGGQVVVGDFNADGKPDVAEEGSGQVLVFLNTTTSGSMSPEFDSFGFDCGFHTALAVGDLNADGKPDLALATSAGRVCVLLNTTVDLASSPTFAGPAEFDTGQDPRGIALGDLNGDGSIDVATADTSDATVSVLLNTTVPAASPPTFASRVAFGSGEAPAAVGIGDLNGDGVPDVALASSSVGGVSVLLNTTAQAAAIPTFSEREDFTMPASASLVISHLTEDTRPDIAAGAVTVLVNRTVEDATMPAFDDPVDFPTRPGGEVRGITSGDLNADGKLDIVVPQYTYDAVSVLLGR